MNLKEYSATKAVEYANQSEADYTGNLEAFMAGCDYIINMDLPVKFRDWENSKEGREYEGSLSCVPSSEELYKHWIENVYKPEPPQPDSDFNDKFMNESK